LCAEQLLHKITSGQVHLLKDLLARDLTDRYTIIGWCWTWCI